MSTNNCEEYQKYVTNIIPKLSTGKHKGQDGRIGIFGGSKEYCGAPFFAGMSALRTGADLVHIFCSKDASIPIKTYSPDLIVHPLLDENNAIQQIEEWLDRLHIILIGPGLGRNENVFNNISEIIEICRIKAKPLVIDADGLFLICQKPDLIKNYPGVILTPNAIEFTRLVKAFLNENIQLQTEDSEVIKRLANAIGENAVILQKGKNDLIADGSHARKIISCNEKGSGRRSGGQGDLLSGSLTVFWWWAIKANQKDAPITPSMTACYGASKLIRECNAVAFKIKHRGMLASDMLEHVQEVFYNTFETDKN